MTIAYQTCGKPFHHMGVSINEGTPSYGWFIVENPIKMDDLRVHPRKPPCTQYCCIDQHPTPRCFMCPVLRSPSVMPAPRSHHKQPYSKKYWNFWPSTSRGQKVATLYYSNLIKSMTISGLRAHVCMLKSCKLPIYSALWHDSKISCWMVTEWWVIMVT